MKRTFATKINNILINSQKKTKKNVYISVNLTTSISDHRRQYTIILNLLSDTLVTKHVIILL